MSYEEEKQDRKIEQLEAEIERLRGEMENYGDDFVCQMKSKDARIQELEDALVEEGTKGLFNGPWDSGLSCGGYDEEMAACRREARRRLQAEGKIGPDAALKKQWDEVLAEGKISSSDHGGEANKLIGLNADHQCQPEAPRSWKITDERKAALSRAYDVISWIDRVDSDNQKHIDVLRAMLKEAGQ